MSDRLTDALKYFCEKLRSTVEGGNEISIITHLDADGIISGSIMAMALRRMGARNSVRATVTERIEWRTRAKGDDALLLVGQSGDNANTVLKAWRASTPLLTDFLNDLKGPDAAAEDLPVEADQRNPEQWGKLVIARAQDSGDVLAIDPEPYWDGIYYWFRAHGLDPHPWNRG